MMEAEYDNAMLLEIIKAHILGFEENTDDVEFVAIEGQTIDDTRLVTFTIGSKNEDVSENVTVKTGDRFKIEF